MNDRDFCQRIIQRRDKPLELFAVLAALTLDLGRQLGAIALGLAVNFNDVADFQIGQLLDAIVEIGVRVGGKSNVS